MNGPHYHVRKTRGWLFRYALFHGYSYPRCHIVAVAMTRRGIMRAMEKDKRDRAIPVSLPGDLVWTEKANGK